MLHQPNWAWQLPKLQEIRHSALEVLFDILRYHGGSFAQSFWVRIFDSVLLPIFDHVRAEVTDTTTFTSEKRRQQEEQWLYETCTRCLQHLVDLFVQVGSCGVVRCSQGRMIACGFNTAARKRLHPTRKDNVCAASPHLRLAATPRLTATTHPLRLPLAQFYDEAFTLLSRLLDLLRGFMNRSHQSLAAVGVAAFVRLAVNAGAHRAGRLKPVPVCVVWACASWGRGLCWGYAGTVHATKRMTQEIGSRIAGAVGFPNAPTAAASSARPGPIMNETCWEMVIAALLAILEETAPEVRDLITPPQRLVGAASALPAGVPMPSGGPQGSGSEITPVAPSSYGSAGSGGPGLGSSPPGGGMMGPPSVAGSGGSGSAAGARAFTLREGVGARRLAKFRCQAATQLLLVQGCSEIYAKAAQVRAAAVTVAGGQRQVVIGFWHVQCVHRNARGV